MKIVILYLIHLFVPLLYHQMFLMCHQMNQMTFNVGMAIGYNEEGERLQRELICEEIKKAQIVILGTEVKRVINADYRSIVVDNLSLFLRLEDKDDIINVNINPILFLYNRQSLNVNYL